MKNQNLKTYNIFWNDLNDDAKRKFKDLYHENININPIAIIDIEKENENEPSNKRNKLFCNECGKSVKLGSGRYVNRVPDLNKYEDRLEMQKPFPEGDFICIECFDSEILSKCCNAPVRYLDCEVCRKAKQQCIWVCTKCGDVILEEHINLKMEN